MDKDIKKYIDKSIMLGLIPFFMVLILEISFKICLGGISGIKYIQPNALFFSILIGYLIYGILLGITKKISSSTIIFSIISILLLIINYIKMIYTLEPLYFSDVNFIGKLNDIVGMVSDSLVTSIIKYLIYIIPLLFIYFLIIKWVRKDEKEIGNIRVRLIIILICIIILIFLFIPSKYTKNIFLSWFFNINSESEGESYINNLNYYYNYSFLAGMYGDLLNNRFYEPENYREEELNNMLENVNQEEKTDTWGTPNIIVVFSESFWDIDKQDDVVFNQEIAPNIKRLKEEGKLIETLSCAYGRLSENIAFELITGGSTNYFSRGYIPIMSLYKRKNSESLPSIIKELEKNNYRSKIVFGKDYYNSEKSMRKIGFDEYIEVEKTDNNIKGKNISDEYLTDLIIKELENKEKDKKIFYMTETIQNHTPFNKDKYESYDISIKYSNLEEDMNDTILSYAQGVHDADKQLNRLYEYIKEYDEPTIIVFLGDHLPYLYTEDGENIMDCIKYFNTGNKLEDLYRKYNTQALVLSNYSIQTNEMPNHLSNSLLLTYIVNQFDIELSDYYKWLYSTIDYLPASNRYVSVDRNGKKYSTDSLSEVMKEVNILRKNMQYKFFVVPTQ